MAVASEKGVSAGRGAAAATSGGGRVSPPGGAVLARMVRQSDVGLAVAVIAILAMMVVPLPPVLLSLLLSLNLTLALVILLTTIYARQPLEFFVFPSLLLLTTLFRLALNVSSTRLILLHGYAGEVIEKFGQFVVGGNPVVGFIVFLILVVIQFVVITRGAERVSEVAARFTLDAMPGKQMSIDADLNAGLIDQEEARRRRREIEREADFYGAMDGASKFVKGDAVAGLVIVAINIVGGFVVGMAQQGLAWQDALHRYTLLTVGDGLVTQIPALLISTGTGILVTRAASEAHLGEDLAGQILAQPRGISIAGASLLLLGLLPGLPKVPFLVLGTAFLAVAYAARSPVPAAESEEPPPAPPAADDVTTPEGMARLLQVDPLEVELGYALLPLADPGRGGDLMSRIGLVRKQLAAELGFVLPLVRVRDNMQLPPNAYVIRLRGAEAARGEVLPEHLLAINPGGAAAAVPGIETRDPTFGLPALWIPADARYQAEAAGYTVVEPAAVLMTHLTHVVRTHAHELLGRQEVRTLLDSVRQRSPVVVDELVPNLLTTGEVQKVLANLLREGVPVRDLTVIMETLADWAPVTRDPDQLTEAARQRLGRQITRDLPLRDGRLLAISLDHGLEQALAAGRDQPPLSPEQLRTVLASLEEAAGRSLAEGAEPVVVCAPVARLRFRRLVERAWPQLRVVSYAELDPDLQIQIVGTVRW